MSRYHICGCYFIDPDRPQSQRIYLPQVKLDAHTTILSTASRTVLNQTFFNPSKEKALDEIRYTFPLFDGVSVVDFVCQIGERTIYGLVKEKNEARKTYQQAKERGEQAALLEQLPDAADVFTTSISNIPKDSSVFVTITYIQELKHDAEVDGVRLTIPTTVSPRYGSYPGEVMEASAVKQSGISLKVDVSMANGVPIQKMVSLSHPIEVSLGSLSTGVDEEASPMSQASATLALDAKELERDFVLQVVAKDVGVPQAILETHPTLSNQWALMTTLVPKFNLKSQRPEIILIADRSGSMRGNIATLIAALKVFLKSIPIGCMFNICSFGSDYKLLWPKSEIYTQERLGKALNHVETFEANFGGTETLKAVKACIEARHKDMPTELMLLTDGDIWQQQGMFEYVANETKNGDVRIFPMGIGGSVSSALIEGVARAGRGFAQMVANNEKMDSKIVRMLKGALMPHIKDYRLEVKYEDDTVDSVTDSLSLKLHFENDEMTKDSGVLEPTTKPISLYDPDTKDEDPKENESKDIFAGLPKLNRPKILQTPHEIPPLYPFNRTCVYLLMASEASHLTPKSVILKGTSPQGPLELEIPVNHREVPDQMIHQLAARKAIQELEEGRGWVSNAVIDSEEGGLARDKYSPQLSLLQRREAVRLGVEFQVGGKYCSFVAVEANEAEIAEKRQKALQSAIERDSSSDSDDWEDLGSSSYSPSGMTSHETPATSMYTGGFAAMACAAPRMQMASRSVVSHAPMATHAFAAPTSVKYKKKKWRGVTDAAFCKLGAEVKELSNPPKPDSKGSGTLLQRLINRQAFDGSWPTIDDLPYEEMYFKIDDAHDIVEHLKSKARDGVDEKMIEALFCTVIAVRFFEKRLTDEMETWELVVEKARLLVEGLEDLVGEEAVAKAWEAGDKLLD
ncbi:hypothetical protein CC80DRAFT_495211 [Byssothecium circinans]|uniref:von Willebrand domain-containing protein n=1 Tax=Byssothecium circinans TaxID=147558 RepID=A0A6A5TJ00_9PLEO|nr:hypothetical protein CC80DRAFT_495211 [Byssothecium circinans]